MTTEQTLKLEFPPSTRVATTVVDSVMSFANRVGIGLASPEAIQVFVQLCLTQVIEQHTKGNAEDPIGVTLSSRAGRFRIEILNKGLPLFNVSDSAANLGVTSAPVEKFHLENCGRNGQKIILEVRATQDTRGSVAMTSLVKSEANTEPLIRKVDQNECALISELFYKVYGYNYINESVYFPEKLAELMATKKLISFGAFLENSLVAHVGLLQLNNAPPVFEACLGVTDPTIKSKGLFSNVFNTVMEHSKSVDMEYCVFDCVTNIDYSQRLIAKHGAVDLALFLGSQNKETQARLSKLGLGDDPKDMDRYSLLLSVTPHRHAVFGETISLPQSLGEEVGFLLEPLGALWVPTSRFEVLQKGGDYSMRLQPGQQACYIDLFEPGIDALERALNAWHDLRTHGYQYCAIDFPLGVAGLNLAHTLLAEDGFFVAGFLPYRFTTQLALRFQTLTYTNVAFDDIKLFSSQAKQLLSLIRSDYERNRAS